MDHAVQTLTGYFRALLGVFLGVFGLIEHACRQAMTAVGIPGSLQQVLLLVVAVLFILAAVRLFAGLFRLILVVFLVLLILHVLIPGAGF